ncbi:hypothetical protein LTR64_008690 [Lithohypha guttulata]|uniref:uncharacterized protein n=1 Tax=Lithohypha guttulata TaxID=1690604 RepID=UPI002DE0717E|nr:hypothetical protein LTR51_008704 [Lithohypha guttulata]
MIAILRVGAPDTISDLLDMIRSGVDLSLLAAHARNARLSDPAIEESFATIEFIIDGPKELPSPTALLTHVPSRSPADSFSSVPISREDIVPDSVSSMTGPSSMNGINSMSGVNSVYDGVSGVDSINGTDGMNEVNRFDSFDRFYTFNGLDG